MSLNKKNWREKIIQAFALFVMYLFMTSGISVDALGSSFTDDISETPSSSAYSPPPDINPDMGTGGSSGSSWDSMSMTDRWSSNPDKVWSENPSWAWSNKPADAENYFLNDLNSEPPKTSLDKIPADKKDAVIKKNIENGKI